MTRLDIFKTALAQTNSLRSRHPDDTVIQSIIKQLDYLVELEERKRNDRERLNDIIIGVLTVREIEPLDESVAETLYKVVEQVEEMKNQGESR
jgi:predicted nucleotidyltransferase